MVSYMVDLLFDPNPSIRELCGACIDVIAAGSDDAFVARIRSQKFRWHNAEWLRLVQADEEAAARGSPVPWTRPGNARDGARRGGAGEGRAEASDFWDDSEDEERLEEAQTGAGRRNGLGHMSLTELAEVLALE